MTARPPVIIIGMHRSGTSMVTRALEKLGLFVGWRKDDNNEALFFFRLNEWMLRQAGASWDRPGPFAAVFGDETMMSMLTRALDEALSGGRGIEFWGARGLLRFARRFETHRPWGWKDPRNTITLPIWLRLFPSAKVVHVRRHGLDVAASLVSRNTAIARKRRGQRLCMPFPLLHMRRLWVSPHVNSIEDGFRLWDEYMGAAETHARQLGSRVMDLKYEDFLAAPEATMERLAEFCDLPGDDGTISRVAAALRVERAYAYRTDRRLVPLAENLKGRLSVYGY